MDKFNKVVTIGIIVIIVMSLFYAFEPMLDAAFPYETYSTDVEYTITDYDINIDVDENNIINVTENITADFSTYGHGIFRYIPYNFYVYRNDGSKSHAKVKITDINCSESFTVKNESGNRIIKIGDPNEYVLNKHSYTISYKYDIGADLLNGADEFYFNIIGNGWETTINNLTFTVNMPKDFDKSKIGFSCGEYGSLGYDNIEYTSAGNKIIGKATDSLMPNEALTIRIELPEGYFRFDRNNTYVFLMIIIPLICFLFIFIIWSSFGKDKKISDTFEFYPPENMSSLDIAYWYKGRLKDKDVTALLLELANEGYVSIRENLPDEYRIDKIKNYNESESPKAIFMSGLFANGNSTDTNDLEYRFYKYTDRILKKYNTKEQRKQVFSEDSLRMRLLCRIVIAACIVSLSVIHFFAYSTPVCNYVYFVGLILCVVKFAFSFLVRRRTDKGHEKLRKIKGFKKFLKTCEKEKLEQLVEESPEYFYDILPYAYVLGISDKWIKKFESINLKPPKWYVGISSSNSKPPIHFIRYTVNDCQSSMISAPRKTGGNIGGVHFGGGGFSGGGFSGGGFGGGGGGGW